MCDTSCLRCKNVMRSPEEIVREKERERPPKAALQTAKGRRTGGGPGGGPGGVKGTGDFVPKTPGPNVFSLIFAFLGVGICGNSK